MKAYLDSSVLLRVVLGEPKRLPEWSRISAAVTSEIARVECLRALDRLRLAGGMDDRELSRRRATMLTLLSGIETVRVNRAVLDRASEAFPTQVRTLDAVHLASAFARARPYGGPAVCHTRRRAGYGSARGRPARDRRKLKSTSAAPLVTARSVYAEGAASASGARPSVSAERSIDTAVYSTTTITSQRTA